MRGRLTDEDIVINRSPISTYKQSVGESAIKLNTVHIQRWHGQKRSVCRYRYAVQTSSDAVGVMTQTKDKMIDQRTVRGGCIVTNRGFKWKV